MSSNSRKIDEIVIEFNFKGKKYSTKEKTIIKNSTKTYPVALSLDPKIKQTLVFNF